MIESTRALKTWMDGSFILSGPGDHEERAKAILKDERLTLITVTVKKETEGKITRTKILFSGLADFTLYAGWYLANKLNDILHVAAACIHRIRLYEPPAPLTKAKRPRELASGQPI